MNTGKFIHVLLMALLCYGQLVTSIHAVGHYDTVAAERAGHVTFYSDPRTATHTVVHTTGAAHSHASDTAGPDTENDCTIYHTYLNHVSVLCAPRHHGMVVFRQSTASLYALTHPVGFAVQSLPIRAPPTVS